MRQVKVSFIGGPYDGASERRSDIFLDNACSAILCSNAFVGGDVPRLRLAHVYRSWPLTNDPVAGVVRMYHSGCSIVGSETPSQ